MDPVTIGRVLSAIAAALGSGAELDIRIHSGPVM